MKNIRNTLMILIVGSAIGADIGIMVESTLYCFDGWYSSVGLISGAMIGMATSILVFFCPVKIIHKVYQRLKYSIFKRQKATSRLAKI